MSGQQRVSLISFLALLGCIISLILFSLFLNELQESISIGSHGIDLDTMKIFVLLFADDYNV